MVEVGRILFIWSGSELVDVYPCLIVHSFMNSFDVRVDGNLSGQLDMLAKELER